MNVTFLQELFGSIAEQGRSLLPKSLFGVEGDADINGLARALTSGRGEASGVAVARALLDRYAELDGEGRTRFFKFLASGMQPNPARVADAARAYLDAPSPLELSRLQKALESPRTEFFRRLHLAPGATPEIVAMRHDLLRVLPADPELMGVDADLRRLFYVWFNRGFLVLRRIDWNTPAVILEKIIRYEAVHEIQGWDDLRRRLDPADRRCFAFFHPSLVDEPLVFVEVALMRDVPDAIEQVLEEPHAEPDSKAPTAAIFYSISNCQEGLKGITFGSFLLKQVVEELMREQPSLKNFVTLSPAPKFASWLRAAARSAEQGDNEERDVAAEARALLAAVGASDWPATVNGDTEAAEAIEASMLSLAAQYYLNAKGVDGRPVDPVARFHLGNGARLDRINYLADTSDKGLRDAFGIMVNYRYDPKEIERNHEDYANGGVIAASRAVRAMLKLKPKVPLGHADGAGAQPALPAPEGAGNASDGRAPAMSEKAVP
ncbi:malonyl-CoA decarboxylase [Hyphomicrobium sulfonivorans]|uniref:malonyl-CoA decarboxylase n=1 Tax=Hyphomicrobium sulfonivorans TaxID=121290 RepID=UPI00156EE4CB|nr:malonyl-CoA decarboxylase [Hyphomicrobium sulfonivorans]MBI1650337.1 malonyl-CoA decarboxylase [Hyphomicrobium sulfonivorans]NSL72299.1 MCD, Malonyl-CoA decarboxylase MCD [Hyphomicrobium sulfonivorans]